MREIKFRGFHPNENGKEKVFVNGEWINGFWVSGLLVKQVDLDGSDEICIQTWERDSEGVSNRVLSVIPETVGQYTGLKDKNGKKIFEADVVRDNESGLFGKVIFATAECGYDGFSGFMADDINDGLQNYNGFWHLVEVAGNIFDNPELVSGV